jgi:hypothetical protein
MEVKNNPTDYEMRCVAAFTLLEKHFLHSERELHDNNTSRSLIELMEFIIDQLSCV